MVQLRNGADLIPQLVETVRGYETRKRNSPRCGGSPRGRDERRRSTRRSPRGKLTSALHGASGHRVGSYPDLKASANFMQLRGRNRGRRGNLTEIRVLQFRDKGMSNSDVPHRTFRRNVQIPAARRCSTWARDRADLNSSESPVLIRAFVCGGSLSRRVSDTAERSSPLSIFTAGPLLIFALTFIACLSRAWAPGLRR